MRSSQTPNKYLLVTLALLVVPISGLSIDIYVPSLPAVTQYYGVDKALTQLTITTYMIGLGIMQLFAGSISDSFGRKKPFNIAMIIFIISTLLVIFSPGIYSFMALRFIQGLAIAMTVVPMRAVISDLFEGREFYKMINYMTMAWSIGPIIAPAIGGYLQYYFGWQSNFYFLIIYSVIIFILSLLYLPETSKHYQPFHARKIILRYRQILSHHQFISGILTNGVLYSLIILFSIVGPFLIQTVMGYSAVQFGHIALLMGLAWFLGTMTNRFLLDVELTTKATVCFWSMLAIALTMLIIVSTMPMTIYNVVIPVFVLLWVGGTAFPNYYARAVALFPEATASANSLAGGSIFFIAGVSSGFSTLLKSTSEVPLVLGYIFLISLCLIIHYLEIFSRKKTK